MTLEEQIAAGGILSGAEMVTHCTDCGEPSTASIQGAAAFLVINGLDYCKPCAAIRQSGGDPKMALLIRELRCPRP